MSGCFTDKYTDYPFTPLPFLSTSDQPYAPVMKTPQLSFSRIVRESGTTLVVTMGLYLVPGCTVALLSTANYRQVMGPRRKPCGTILAHGTTIMELIRAVPICSHPVANNAPSGTIEQLFIRTNRLVDLVLSQ